MTTKRLLGLILAAAGMIDIVIAAVITDSVARTVVFISGITTVAVGIVLFVAALRQGHR